MMYELDFTDYFALLIFPIRLPFLKHNGPGAEKYKFDERQARILDFEKSLI